MKLLSRNRRSSGGNRDQSPLWLTIFSDMTTNLTLFFLLLFVLSRMDAAERARMMSGLEDVFQSEETRIETRMDRALEKAREAEAIRELQERVLQEDLRGQASVAVLPETVRLTLNLPILFESGSPEIGSAVLDILESLAPPLAKFPGDVIVEGHTDDVPIRGGRYPSNWELSIARAVSVIDFYADLGIPEAHFVSAGYGEYRPVATNETAEGRARNRRIEVLIRRVL